MKIFIIFIVFLIIFFPKKILCNPLIYSGKVLENTMPSEISTNIHDNINDRPISTEKVQFLAASSKTLSGQQLLANIGRFPIVSSLSDPRMSDPFQSPDALYVGGLPTQGWEINGAPKNKKTRPGSLVVSGQPWGPFNASTLESLLMGSEVDQQNGVCAVDWRAGAGYICGGDGVAQYIGVTNVSALIIGEVSSFTSNSVILKNPLNFYQLSQLRVGMYITTNIVNKNIIKYQNSFDSWGNKKIHQQYYYLSVISGWNSNGNVIKVSGWDIPLATTHPKEQIPGHQQGDSLDDWSSKYDKPVVFIGNPNNGSAHNEYLDYKGYKAGDDIIKHTTNVGHATATAHALSGDEIDLRYWATRPNEVHLDGITISIAGDFGTPVGRAALSQDSYGLAISGDIHNSLILDGPSDGNTILSHSFYLHGNEGVQTIGEINRPISTIFGFTANVDSNNYYSLIGWLNKDRPKINGIDGASFHLGVVGNNNIYLPSFNPHQNGAGEIIWNNNGKNIGGLSFCGSHECSIHILSNGIINITKEIFTKNDLNINNGKYLVLYPKNHIDGASYLEADGINSVKISGVDGKKTHLNVGAIDVAHEIVAQSYTEKLKTPSSSSAPCRVGQFSDDMNYHYVCVALNKWKRVALNAF